MVADSKRIEADNLGNVPRCDRNAPCIATFPQPDECYSPLCIPFLQPPVVATGEIAGIAQKPKTTIKERPMRRRLYLHAMKDSRIAPLAKRYWFRSDRDKAMRWQSYERAMYDRDWIEENSPRIGTYMCNGFQIEETDHTFVIFCEVPVHCLAEMIPSSERW